MTKNKYIVSVLSEKLVSLVKEYSPEKRLYDLTDCEWNPIYYGVSATPDSDTHFDESVEAIDFFESVSVLLKEGANLFNISENNQQLVLGEILNNNFKGKFKTKFNNIILSKVLTSDFDNLIIKYGNSLFNHMINNENLPDLMNLGLKYRQDFELENYPLEIDKLKNGDKEFFQIVEILQPGTFDFKKKYTYENKEKYTLNEYIEVYSHIDEKDSNFENKKLTNSFLKMISLKQSLDENIEKKQETKKMKI